MMSKNKPISIPALLMSVLLLAGLMPASAVAQEDSWNFRFTPYIWGTKFKGTSTVGQNEADIDLSFGDILDDLDVALMGDFRAEKGPWAIQSNFVWSDMTSKENVGPIKIKVEPRMVFLDLEGRYRIAPPWELLAGIRYYHVKTRIEIDTPLGQRGGSDSETWVDPIIGAALRTPINDRWAFAARADIGGFGVGSDFSWEAWAVLDYRFSETTSVTFGYRHLDFDYEDGSGGNKFGLDAYLTGPVLGASFRF